MSTTAFIEKGKLRGVVSICPSQLTDHYHETLLSVVKKKYEKQSFQKIGYIFEVIQILHIENDWIASLTSDVKFQLVMEIWYVMPQKDKCLEVPISMIFTHGVFCPFENIGILIPHHLCMPFQIIKDFSSFYLQHPHTKQTYRPHDLVTIKLVDVRFEINKFHCIAKLKDQSCDTDV